MVKGKLIPCLYNIMKVDDESMQKVAEHPLNFAYLQFNF
jgi:hypothetical protein